MKFPKLLERLIPLTFASVFAALMFPYKFGAFSVLVILSLLVLIFLNPKFKFNFWKNEILILYFAYLIIYIFNSIIFIKPYFDVYFSDLRNAITLTLLLFVCLIFIRTKKLLLKILDQTYLIIYLVAVISSLFGLYKFFQMLNGVQIPFFISPDGTYPIGTSLMNDYNIYSLGLFSSLIIGISFLQLNLTVLTRLSLWLFNLLIVINILLSGSRRSLVILFLLGILYLYNLSRTEYLESIRILVSEFKLKKSLFRPLFFLTLVSILIVSVSNKINFSEINLDQINRIVVRAESLKSTSNSFQQRTDRWNMSIDLINQLTLPEILFGNGYAYWKNFSKDNSRYGSNYPHNLFLSTFFANGLFGLLVISFYLIYTFKYYYNYKTHLKPFFLLFSISIIYLFISGDQFFSNKAIVLLTFFPLLFKSLEYEE